MTPPELSLSGLASCAAFYAIAYLENKGLERAGVTVHATAQKAARPRASISSTSRSTCPAP